MKKLTRKQNINTMLHYYYFGKSFTNSAAKTVLPVLLLVTGILLVEYARNDTDIAFGVVFITLGAYSMLKPYIAIFLNRKELNDIFIETKIEDNKLIINKFHSDTNEPAAKIEIDLDALTKVKHKQHYYILFFQGYRPMILPESIVSDEVKQYLDMML